MTRVALLPADLKDGRYVMSFHALEIDQLWCGRREVWIPPHGRATRYHVMIDGGVAACRPKQLSWANRSVILLGDLLPIGDVPNNLCCQRNGCRQLFESY